MKRDEYASVVFCVILVLVLLFGLYEAFWSLSEILSLGPYFILGGIFAVLLWGFRERIEGAFNHKDSESSDSVLGIHRESSEYANQRKKDIWNAIEEWVSSPTQIGFGVNRGERDWLLPTEPPKLATEIDACLKNYPNVWNTLQEFRAKCATPMTSTTPDGIALESAMTGLTRLSAILAQEIRRDVLGKHFTELKC